MLQRQAGIAPDMETLNLLAGSCSNVHTVEDLFKFARQYGIQVSKSLPFGTLTNTRRRRRLQLASALCFFHPSHFYVLERFAVECRHVLSCDIIAVSIQAILVWSSCVAGQDDRTEHSNSKVLAAFLLFFLKVFSLSHSLYISQTNTQRCVEQVYHG
jgi:hypothetical protein